MRKVIIPLMLFICFCITMSQNKAIDSSRSAWSGNYNLRGFYMKGNINKLYAASGGEIKRQDSIYTMDLIVSLDYGETNKIKDVNSFFGDFSTDLFHYNTLSPLFLQIGEFNFGRGIVFRSQTGAGLKLNFIKHPEHKTSISLAGIYDYTNLINKRGNNDGRIWRLSWRFKTKQILFNKRLIISNVTFYQPSVKSIANTIWRSETKLEAPIVKSLSINITYLYTHEDVVSVGRKKSDHNISFGLGLILGVDR